MRRPKAHRQVASRLQFRLCGRWGRGSRHVLSFLYPALAFACQALSGQVPCHGHPIRPAVQLVKPHRTLLWSSLPVLQNPTSQTAPRMRASLSGCSTATTVAGLMENHSWCPFSWLLQLYCSRTYIGDFPLHVRGLPQSLPNCLARQAGSLIQARR